MAKGFTYVMGAFIFLVLLKDGTIPTLIQNGATFLQTGARGLRPLSRIG